MTKVIAPLLLLTSLACASEDSKRSVAWDLKSLFKTPKVHKTEERPAKGLRSFFYEGALYKAAPDTIQSAPCKAPYGG